MRMSEQLALVNRFMDRAPVDVESLAMALGAPVHRAYLDAEVSGMLERTKAGFRIVVNAAHPSTRQRFTIAHELGHFLFHRHLIGEGIDDDRAYRSTPSGRFKNMNIGPAQETEANRFAATLLMPTNLIDQARVDGANSPREIARRLGVSEHAMCIRLGEPYEDRML